MRSEDRLKTVGYERGQHFPLPLPNFPDIIDRKVGGFWLAFHWPAVGAMLVLMWFLRQAGPAGRLCLWQRAFVKTEDAGSCAVDIGGVFGICVSMEEPGGAGMGVGLDERCKGLPPGAVYVASFISPDEEAVLVRHLDKGGWSAELKRRVQHFGPLRLQGAGGQPGCLFGAPSRMAPRGLRPAGVGGSSGRVCGPGDCE